MRVGIIGQGFGGTALAWRAHWAGHEVVLFDRGLDASASWVAAGLVNPIVLKRKRLVGEAMAHIDAFSPFYERVEQEIGCSVRFPGEIHEVLPDGAAENAWAALGAERGFEPFIGALLPVPDARFCASSLAPVRQSARLRVQTYLSESREFFTQHHRLVEAMVEHIEHHKGQWHVGEKEQVDVLLLAEGVQAQWTQHFFGTLPFAPTKGEGLRIRWEGPELPVAVHKNVFLLPEGDGSYQVGSTYAWEGIDEGPTEKARAEILEKLRGWFEQEVEVLDHWTGVRPTMRNRQPVYGWHSELPGLGYLNGLGSRGALTTPLLSARLWGLHSDRTSQKS